MFKNAETEKDLNLTVMMETIKMEMDAQLIVKLSPDGHAQEDQALSQVSVFKGLQKDHILS